MTMRNITLYVSIMLATTTAYGSQKHKTVARDLRHSTSSPFRKRIIVNEVAKALEKQVDTFDALAKRLIESNPAFLDMSLSEYKHSVATLYSNTRKYMDAILWDTPIATDKKPEERIERFPKYVMEHFVELRELRDYYSNFFDEDSDA